MDLVPMWFVARGSANSIVWIGIRNFPLWPPQARAWFLLEFGNPTIFQPTFYSVQVLEVDTIVALTITWDVLMGLQKKLADVDEAILDLLPTFEGNFDWDDDEEQDTSSIDTS